MVHVLEWLGCIFGVTGAAYLARNSRWSGYGFIFFLASNVAWISFGIMTDAYSMLVMQCAFTITSLVGIRRWLIQPRKDDQIEAMAAECKRAQDLLRQAVAELQRNQGSSCQDHGAKDLIAEANAYFGPVESCVPSRQKGVKGLRAL